MLISEAISQLTMIKELHGDVPIRMCDERFWHNFSNVLNVNEIKQAEFFHDHVLLIPVMNESYAYDYNLNCKV